MKNLTKKTLLTDQNSKELIELGCQQVCQVHFSQPPLSEQRSLIEIPSAALDNYLYHFILEIRKPDGEDYEPDSSASFRNSIHIFINVRHLCGHL